MQTNIITNWQGINPNQLYAEALQNGPVQFDDAAQTWVVYSYDACRQILENPNAQIPQIPQNPLLNDTANQFIQKLARLTNGEQHTLSRQAAMQLFNGIQQINIADILPALIIANQTDWVNDVCKKLPILYLMKGLGFDDDACEYMIQNIATLVKLMSPLKTNEDCEALNPLVNSLVHLCQKHIQSSGVLKAIPQVEHTNWAELYTINLIGLFIQSYDACRGLLCNSVIQLSQHHSGLSQQNNEFYNQAITEVLRFDSPVHNTRRVAVADIAIGKQIIKAGDKIMVLMAAANMDETVFADPQQYNFSRSNNNQHLSFGAGGHACIAKHICIKIAADTCRWLFQNYNKVNIPEQTISFEPQLNVRLIKNLFINISN